MMRKMMLLAMPLMMAATDGAAPTRDQLAGEWTVDLSVKPGEPYTRPMQLELKNDGTVAGLFYQSPIDTGRWKIDRGRICASFRTHDERGPYHSTACATAAGVQGQTWAEARNFLFNWNAVRGKPTP